MNTMTINYSPDAYSRKRLLQIYPQPGCLLWVPLHPDPGAVRKLNLMQLCLRHAE